MATMYMFELSYLSLSFSIYIPSAHTGGGSVGGQRGALGARFSSSSYYDLQKHIHTMIDDKHKTVKAKYIYITD